MRLGQVVHVSIFYNTEILGFRHSKVLILVFDGVIVKTMHQSGSAGGVVVYQYTRKKFAKIPKNTQNSSKYTQNYTQVYFIPEIQRK